MKHKLIRYILSCTLLFFVNTLQAQEEITQVPEYESLDKMVDYAKTLERRPYRLGATGPYAFDCSGFTQFCFKKVGITLNRNSKQQAEQGKKIRKRKYLKTGDLVCFNGSKIGDEVGHVGIVVNNNDGVFTFIHASSSIGITISSSDTKYFDDRYLQGRRITTDKKIRRALKKYANYVADSTAIAKGEKEAEELDMPDESTSQSKKKGWWNRIRERRAARKKAKTEQEATEKSQNSTTSNSSNKQSKKTATNTNKQNSANKQNSSSTQKTTNGSEKQNSNSAEKKVNNSTKQNSTPKSAEQTSNTTEKKSTPTTIVKKEEPAVQKVTADTAKSTSKELTPQEKVEKAFKKTTDVAKETTIKPSSTDTAKAKEGNSSASMTENTGANLVKTLTGPYHKVEKGDTLYNIAKRAGCTVQELRDWNNLTNDALSIGQVIRVKAEK